MCPPLGRRCRISLRGTQVTRRANRKKRLTVLYIVEHPNQEGDTCIDWTSQYCWTNGWNCLWRGHSVYRNRPLIPPDVESQATGLKFWNNLEQLSMVPDRQKKKNIFNQDFSAMAQLSHRSSCFRKIGKRAKGKFMPNHVIGTCNLQQDDLGQIYGPLGYRIRQPTTNPSAHGCDCRRGRNIDFRRH